MGDDNKLDPKMYNLILDNFLNGTPLPKESKPYEYYSRCFHNLEEEYHGLFRIEYICKDCGNRRQSEDPMPMSKDWNHDEDQF